MKAPTEIWVLTFNLPNASSLLKSHDFVVGLTVFNSSSRSHDADDETQKSHDKPQAAQAHVSSGW